MPLPRYLFSPAFQHQHLGRSFAAIVGIMVFIASFAMAAESTLLTASYVWGRTTETQLTVEIPAMGDETSVPQSDRVKQALSILNAIPEVERASPLDDKEVERLLSPWFNKPELLKTLPLPVLIDVSLKQGATLDAEKIEESLKPALNDVRINAHGTWTQDVWRLVHGLTLLGGLTIVLTAIALFIAVNLICRAVIATENETISLLHLMGAENRDVARHFQRQATSIAAKAAASGFALALAIILVLLLSTRHIANFSLLGWLDWMTVGFFSISVPICATLIAAFAARLSVLRLIRSFP